MSDWYEASRLLGHNTVQEDRSRNARTSEHRLSIRAHHNRFRGSRRRVELRSPRQTMVSGSARRHGGHESRLVSLGVRLRPIKHRCLGRARLLAMAAHWAAGTCVVGRRDPPLVGMASGRLDPDSLDRLRRGNGSVRIHPRLRHIGDRPDLPLHAQSDWPRCRRLAGQFDRC